MKSLILNNCRNEGHWKKFDISRPLVVIKVIDNFTIFHYCLFQHKTVSKCSQILLPKAIVQIVANIYPHL